MCESCRLILSQISFKTVTAQKKNLKSFKALPTVH